LEFETSGEYEFIFGFEESYGSLNGTYTRDKDAVSASLLLCEMAAFYRQQGHTLLDALNDLYKKYGYYGESVESITYSGIEGQKNISKIMSALRSSPPQSFNHSVIIETRDYLTQTITHPNGSTETTGLPVSDVLYYACADGSWICVRPSGTEPKIKLYFGVIVYGDIQIVKTQADDKLHELMAAIKKIVSNAINN
jgi:phosphoglucomutase